jgi:hypothetical protein
MNLTFDPTYIHYLNKQVLIIHHSHIHNDNSEIINIDVHENRGILKKITLPNHDNDRSIIIINFMPNASYPVHHTFVSSLYNFQIYLDRTQQTKYNMYLFFHHVRRKLYRDVRYVISKFLIYDYEEILL